MADLGPLWTAPRHANDWRDEETLRAVNWLKSFVPSAEMQRRLDVCQDTFLRARPQWERNEEVTLFNPSDTAAWFIFQAETYATDRRYWMPEAATRVVPYLRRLGAELDRLREIEGCDERAERLMCSEKAQPDSGIYELLVALAYRRHGWSTVKFVPEQRGISRTPDLHVSKRGTRWAVECKRLRPSSYADEEAAYGRQLARPVHQLCESQNKSIVVEIRYQVELDQLPEHFLIEAIADNLRQSESFEFHSDEASIRVRPVTWGLFNQVSARDYVYYGSSRMIELLSGRYEHHAQHSMSARWVRSSAMPMYADSVSQASVVSWVSCSDEAIAAKARHFRRVVGRAESQLPNDRPGVLHIGLECSEDTGVELHRHLSNHFEVTDFTPRKSRLRWVYGNLFLPELTTRHDESCALEETMIPYRVGSHRTTWPLPGHLLVAPDDTARPGVHWDQN